jgi:hypothetical protein
MGENEWKESETWPPEGVRFEKRYLGSGHGANGLAGDGRLSPLPPVAAGIDTFTYDPLHPVPTVGGVNFHFFTDNLLGVTGIRIPAGNRLRVEISSSNFPKYDRNPNTGEDPATATESRTVRQRVYHSPEYPSHLLLPVLSRTGGATGSEAPEGAREILERYARAWRGREEMPLDTAVILGFRIRGEGGGDFHVVLPPEGGAELRPGEPAPGAALVTTFETDIDFLRRLDRGELNALTATVQATGHDPIPLVPHHPEGFRWTPEARAFVYPLWFHFWNRDWPEVIPFGDGRTRQAHGANATVFYYDRGLRTMRHQLGPGMRLGGAGGHAHTTTFSYLVVTTRGEMHAHRRRNAHAARRRGGPHPVAGGGGVLDHTRAVRGVHRGHLRRGSLAAPRSGRVTTARPRSSWSRESCIMKSFWLGGRRVISRASLRPRSGP